MKRDMSLIREILLWAIDQPHGYVNGNPSIDGYTKEQIGFHVYLMHQAGLVDAAIREVVGLPSPEGLLIGIKWSGYEFADAARDNAVWKKATKTVLKDGASFTFDVLKEWLKSEAKRHLGIPDDLL